MEDFELGKYIYIEYSLAVLVLTDLVKMLLQNIQLKFVQFVVVKNPKWLTLLIASFLSALDWLVIGNAHNFHLYQYIISFGVTILGYDYVYKLIKDQILKFRNQT